MALAQPNVKAVHAQMAARARTIEEAYADIIDEHGKAKGKRLINRALQPVFSGLIGRTKSATPKRTGRLRKSVKIKPQQRRGFIYGARFGFFARHRVSAVLGIEFGNARTRARSVLRNAWRAEEPRIEGALGDALEREVDKIVARANARGRRRMRAAARR